LFHNDSDYYGKDSQVTMHIDQIELSNVHYKATLKRNDKSADWLLVKQDAADDDARRSKSRRGASCPWLMCGNIYILDWVADDCFVISQVEELSTSGIWRVYFKHDETRRKNLPSATQINAESGYIEVDPAHSFRPTAFKYAIKTKGNGRYYSGVTIGTLNYDSAGSLPILKEKTEETELPSQELGVRKSKLVSTYTIEYNGKISEEEFRFSHYGLPEPPDVGWSKPIPTFVWLLTGAGVCAVVATGFRQLARRHRESAA
jgi:hypothetical protein